MIRLEADGQFRFGETNFASAKFAAHPWLSMRGMAVQEALAPPIRDHLESALRLCIETGEAQHFEEEIDLPSGRVAWTANLVPLGDDGTGVCEVAALTLPMPIRRHASGVEAKNHYLIEGLSGSSGDLIFLWDAPTRRIIFVDGQLERLLGLEPYELEEMNDPLSYLVCAEDLPGVKARIAAVLADRSDAGATFSCRIRRTDGRHRYLAVHNRVLDRTVNGKARTLLGIARDVTDEELHKEEVALLEARLSSVQMDERRQIAQELHDSAGQYLIAAELALARARERCPGLERNAVAASALDEAMICIKDAEREIRVLSYLMHPPAISAPTPSAALRNFAAGFGHRAGIVMDVTIDKKLDKAAPHLAVPLLRVCQEALSNVHRHAKANAVSVKLSVTGENIILEVADDGVGFKHRNNSGEWSGLGLSSMRDRIERLGGSLCIASDKGTRLRAIIPKFD